MDNFKDKTVLVYDHGYHQELALRLSRDFGRTLYFKPWKEATPRYRRLFVGDGDEKVTRVRDFFKVIDEVDLFVFPWVYDADLQLHLEKMGKRVWGSRDAEKYEFRRGFFKHALEDVGLPVPEYKEITGMDSLRDFLDSHSTEEWIVKLDLLRGDGETFKLENPILTKSILNEMDAYYGAAREFVRFVVEKCIETKSEVGYDGFTIDGEFTDGFVDYEIKNKCCIASFTPYSEMNEHVRTVNEKFAPKLAECRARSMWGTEIRIDKEDTPYFIDATPRMPSPPGELMLEMIDNLSEILWKGSVGEFVQSKSTHAIGVQVMIFADWEDLPLLPVIVPEEIRKWVKLGAHFQADDCAQMIQNCGEEQVRWLREQVACVIGLSDNIEDAIDLTLERASQVKGANLEIMELALVEALKTIKEGQKQGIEFSDKPIPEPSTVLEDK